jgi:hypothetical protein
MKKEDSSSSTSSQPILESKDPKNQRRQKHLRRRSFLKGIGMASAASVGAGLLAHGSSVLAQEGPEEQSGSLTPGDAALLMRRVLVDTGLIVAILSRRHKFHGACVDALGLPRACVGQLSPKPLGSYAETRTRYKNA